MIGFDKAILNVINGWCLYDGTKTDNKISHCAYFNAPFFSNSMVMSADSSEYFFSLKTSNITEIVRYRLDPAIPLQIAAEYDTKALENPGLWRDPNSFDVVGSVPGYGQNDTIYYFKYDVNYTNSSLFSVRKMYDSNYNCSYFSQQIYQMKNHFWHTTGLHIDLTPKQMVCFIKGIKLRCLQHDITMKLNDKYNQCGFGGMSLLSYDLPPPEDIDHIITNGIGTENLNMIILAAYNSNQGKGIIRVLEVQITSLPYLVQDFTPEKIYTLSQMTAYTTIVSRQYLSPANLDIFVGGTFSEWVDSNLS